MRFFVGLSLAACLATAAHAAPKLGDAPMVIADSERTIGGGRGVLLEIPQTQIETSVDIGRVASPPSGGILDTIIISSMNNSRKILKTAQQERADGIARPLRDTLQNFDIDALALATTDAALAKVTWFEPQAAILSREASPARRKTFVDSTATAQLAFIAYRYDLSPDFTQIRLVADISLAKRSGTGGKIAATPFYRQRISSIAQLRKRSYEPSENTAMWSADGGKLAKEALTAGFARLGHLIPYALGLNPDEVKRFAAKGSEQGFAAGLYGPLIERRQETVLIWSDGLVEVQAVPLETAALATSP